jgi:hypothetical protein
MAGRGISNMLGFISPGATQQSSLEATSKPQSSPLKRKRKDVFYASRKSIDETTAYWKEWLSRRECPGHNKKPVITNVAAAGTVRGLR